MIVGKGDKAIWRNTYEKRPVHQIEPTRTTLEMHCASAAVAKTIASLVGVSDHPLRETAKGSPAEDQGIPPSGKPTVIE